VIKKALRIEVQNGSIPRPYLELQIEPGEVNVVANSSPSDEIKKTYLKFDEYEFVELCKEYLKIVAQHDKNE